MKSGEHVPLHVTNMKITMDMKQLPDNTLCFSPFIPITIIHPIDPTSPLYPMSRVQLEQADFELVVVLEGKIPTTGSTTQAVTSYKPPEVLWGHHFKSLFDAQQPRVQDVDAIDLSCLHVTFADGVTPECSASEYHRQNNNNYNNNNNHHLTSNLTASSSSVGSEWNDSPAGSSIWRSAKELDFVVNMLD